MTDKAFYTVKEFAELIGVHPNTVRKSIKIGKLDAIKFAEGKTSKLFIPVTEANRLAIMNKSFIQ